MIKLCCVKVKCVSKTTTKLNFTQECDELNASNLLFKLDLCLQSNRRGARLQKYIQHSRLIHSDLTAERKLKQTPSREPKTHHFQPKPPRPAAYSRTPRPSLTPVPVTTVRCDNSNWKPLPSSELFKEVDSNRALAHWPMTG